MIPDEGSDDDKPRTTANKASRLWTIGGSFGSSFAAPWVISTVHGTIAPFKNSFLEIGLDIGLESGDPYVSYYSIYPFVHYAFFVPFKSSGGWYIGAGGGYMYANYSFPNESFVEPFVDDVTISTFAADLTTGFNIMNIIDISYTLHTNFTSASNKISVGYTYRFKYRE